jgi:uncharacterized membrane protein
MQDTPPAPESQEASPTPPPSGQRPSDQTAMLVLSYLGILALIPLLVEKENSEIQWHAKHGLTLIVGWIVLSIAIAILAAIPVVGPFLGCAVAPFLWLVILIVHIVAIVKALKGERLMVPVISDFVDKW